MNTSNDLTSASILVIDDDVADRKMIADIVTSLEMPCVELNNIESARELFARHNWYLILLHSRKNPDGALELCRWFHAHSTVPIIMLTHRDETHTEQTVLANGAEDYIVKPLQEKVVVSRIVQQLYRVAPNHKLAHEEHLTQGAITLDLKGHTCKVAGVEVTLTPTEFAILTELLSHSGQVVPRSALTMLLGIDNSFISDHGLDTHLNRMRKKLHAAGLPKIIETVYGVGFRLISD